MQEDTLYTAICHSATLYSTKEGFFKDFIEAVTEEAGRSWVSNFNKINDDQQKLIECFNNKKTTEILHGTLKNIQELYRGKSSFISTQRRKEGKAFLEENEPQKALLLLTQSVMKAPQTGADKSEWCSALWDRSHLLLSQGEFSFCLSDVQICLKNGLPENLKADAYWRMAECYFGLKENSKGKLTLLILEKWVEKAFPADDALLREWKTKLREKIKEVPRLMPFEENKPHSHKVPTLTKGPLIEFPCASSTLRLTETKVGGKFFVARDPIKAGDTLIVENAFAACLLPEKCGTHCHHCFQRLKIPMPCSTCSGVSFCSVDCMEEASSSYHRFECKYLDLMIGAGMSILCFIALRIITQQKLDFFLRVKDKLKDPKSCDYAQLYNLVTHSDKRSSEDLFQRTLMSLFLLHILKKSGYFGLEATSFTEKLSATEVFIGSLIIRHLQLLQFNAHEIYEMLVKAETEAAYCKIHHNNIAVGIYPTASYFNHDCYPAVSRYFVGNKIVLKALRPLATNEAVTENYGPIFTKRARTERQRALLSRYRFQCECRACLENWPLFDNLDDTYQIRCPSPNGCGKTLTRISINKNNKQKSNKKDIKCSSCGYCAESSFLQKTEELIHSLDKKYQEGKKELDRGNISAAISSLSAYSNEISALCIPPVKTLTLAHEALRICWANDGSKIILP
nr:PREDICTED: SET and MYND domain-containing protein 4 [Bemisia tabaci]